METDNDRATAMMPKPVLERKTYVQEKKKKKTERKYFKILNVLGESHGRKRIFFSFPFYLLMSRVYVLFL